MAKDKSGKYKYKQCPEGLNEPVYLRIRALRIQMLVHSYIYYSLNENILVDSEFDRRAYELRDLQRDYPAESEACDLAWEFSDWTGITGYHLPNYPWVDGIAKQLLQLDKLKGE